MTNKLADPQLPLRRLGSGGRVMTWHFCEFPARPPRAAGGK
jgi:hypothetical protein